jgi:hypothetical protein
MENFPSINTVMQMIKKLYTWLKPVWTNPDLTNTWVITRIGNHNNFMDFIFSNVESDHKWLIEMVQDHDIVEYLSTISPEGKPIPLTDTNVSKIRDLLFSINFTDDLLHQTIYNESGCLLVAYDNMAHCWVSKQIPIKIMEHAAKLYDFDFEDNAVA